MVSIIFTVKVSEQNEPSEHTIWIFFLIVIVSIIRVLTAKTFKYELNQ